MAKITEPVCEAGESPFLVPRPESQVGERFNVDRRSLPTAGAYVHDDDQARVRPWRTLSDPSEVIGLPALAVETRKRLAHVPLLSLEQLRALPEPRPKEGGVYFLWRDNALVYVGRSPNVLWRLEFFQSKARYAAVHYYQFAIHFDRATLLPFDFPTQEEFHLTTKDYEHAYIATYLPEYNSDYQTAGNCT